MLGFGLEKIVERLGGALSRRGRGGMPPMVGLATFVAVVAGMVVFGPAKRATPVRMPIGEAATETAEKEPPSPAADAFRTDTPLPTVAFRDGRPLVDNTPQLTPAPVGAVAPPPVLPAAPEPVPERARTATAAPATPLQPAAPGDQPSTSGDRAVVPPLVAPKVAVDARHAASCGEPDFTLEARDGGIMALSIASPCRAAQPFSLVYGSVRRSLTLDGVGNAVVDQDLFLGGAKSVDIVFADGMRRVLPVKAVGLDKLSKVAVIWREPVAVDLHALEYETAAGAPGDVSRASPRSFTQAREATATDHRGHGFLSTRADPTGGGDHVVVYTFVHADAQPPGEVSLLLDYGPLPGRPHSETCGDGRMATLAYEFVALAPDGTTSSGKGQTSSLGCDEVKADATRLRRDALPTLRFR